MRQWLSRQLGDALRNHGVTVILDPEGLITDSDLEAIEDTARLVRVADWIQLRTVWDLDIRCRDELKAVAVVIRCSQFSRAEDLPWDVEHEADRVVRVRWPVPAELRDLFTVAGDHADRLAEAARTPASPSSIVATAFGFRPGNPAEELESMVALRLDPATRPEVWDTLRRAYATPLARSVAEHRGDLGTLQQAWNEWLRIGDASPSSEYLRVAPGPLLGLLSAGLLTPAPTNAAGLPSWVGVGSTHPDPETVLSELLAAQPPPPAGFAQWIEMASWWGQVRSLVAAQPVAPAGADRAWDAWAQLDPTFLAWLRSSYATTLLSSPATPKAVHHIAPFLTRRVDDGARLVLVVIDGLGFTQWHQLRTATAVKVLQASGCLAMAPTLTSISRQAIFAGALPIDFNDTIETTAAEPKRWSTFWTEHGVAAKDVAYHKVLGSDRREVPSLSGCVIGIVVNAVDQILHGAEVLGDRQVASAVELWARAGFIEALTAAAVSQGYEVWLTSDHGNLPTVAGPVPKEGQTVESAGTRVRIYPNEVLRSAASEFGVIWDPPGYPRGTRCPLFASGRTGFHTSGTRVSHGGLSLDEVIVPFAQVTV